MRASDLYPRLRSLRSLSLGLLRSQPLRGCKSLVRMVDGDKPHPLHWMTEVSVEQAHPDKQMGDYTQCLGEAHSQ